MPWKKGQSGNKEYRITSENAREMQLRSAEARKKNRIDRMAAIDAARDTLCSFIKVTPAISAMYEQMGEITGKKVMLVDYALKMLMKKAIKRNDAKFLFELIRLGGMHHDQTTEALGGSDNPINVTKKITPEQVREINSMLEDLC